MLGDKVCQPSTNPSHINLSNSVGNNNYVYIVFFDLVKEKKKMNKQRKSVTEKSWTKVATNLFQCLNKKNLIP